MAKILKYLSAMFTIVLFKQFSFGQNTDSLKFALKTAKQDTTICNILNAMIEAESDDRIWSVYNDRINTIAKNNLSTSKDPVLKRTYLKYLAASLNNMGYLQQVNGNSQRALDYFESSLKILSEIKDKKGTASCFNNIGSIYSDNSEIDKALDYFLKSFKLMEEINDLEGMATSLNNMGLIYQNQSNIPRALDYYHRGLKIREQQKNKEGINLSLMYIGTIYVRQKDTSKALFYFNKSLNVAKQINDDNGIAFSLLNIGIINDEKGDYNKALDYYQRSLQLNEKINNKRGICQCLNNIGFVCDKFASQKQTSYSHGKIDSLENKAIEYYRKSLVVARDIKDKEGIAYCLNNISHVKLKQKKLSEALTFALQSLFVSREIGFPENIRNAAEILKIIYKKFNQPEKAIEMHTLFIQMRDSVDHVNNKKASIQSQFQYEYEKKVMSDNIKVNEERKINEARFKQDKMKRYALYGGLLMVGFFAFFIFNRLRISKKQKLIIEKQKELVEEKQKEILDSIIYAQRIQRSLLTSEKYIEKCLNKLIQN